MKGKFEPWRADLILRGLIEGLEGKFEVWRSDLGGRGADLRPGGLN